MTRNKNGTLGCSLIAFCLMLSGLTPHSSGQSALEQHNSHQWLLPIPELVANENVPDSKTILRYHWGDEISNHFQIETYLKALAEAAPDRAKLVQYGESYEGRSLNYLVISSAENMSRLEEIRLNNLRLSDPRTTSHQEAEALAESTPAVVWLAYSVHGNEISPSEAALLTAYHLVADQREQTVKLMNDLVVIIDPLQNPDGRDRFVNVFRETRGRFIQSHPLANEHTERWPNGRSNHYWFDMNRDWFLQSQQEVQAKVAAYLEWQPQIYVDAHEMGRNSTFYFPPPTDPKNPFLMPSQNEWFSRLGKHQAAWFDKYKFGYMTREVFDAFYPGYGSEWPTLQGGLGILWEQASARGLLIDRDDETQLSYRDGVRNHYISALATIEFASQHRAELLKTFHASRARSVRLGEDGDISDFFLITEDRPQRARRLGLVLQRNGIEVKKLNQPLSLECSSSHDGDKQLRTLPTGSLHISVAQPTGTLIRALLDREVQMDDKFLRRQLERNQLRLPDEIYDVTAWSLPLAFDVICYSTRTIEPIDSNLVDLTLNSDRPALVKAEVAYLIPGTDGAMQLIAKLVRDGVRAHVCDETFKINGRHFDRGTLIIKVADNDEGLYETLAQAMRDFDVDIVPTDTAYVDEGAHMGGPEVHWIRPPKVLLVVNQPTNYSSGHTWFLFDQVLEYPVTRVKGREFSNVDLSKFNTVILPDGVYNDVPGFDDTASKSLTEWVSKGGTLITLRGATSWAADENIGLLRNTLVKRKVPAVGSDDDQTEQERVAPDTLPGAFLKAEVFQKHWVTFHFRPEFHPFYTGRIILTPTSETAGRSLVTFVDSDQLLTSGFCWPESLNLLANTPLVVYRSIGQGHVIAFTDDPNYRAMYPSLQRLLINAVMFGAGH